MFRRLTEQEITGEESPEQEQNPEEIRGILEAAAAAKLESEKWVFLTQMTSEGEQMSCPVVVLEMQDDTVFVEAEGYGIPILLSSIKSAKKIVN